MTVCTKRTGTVVYKINKNVALCANVEVNLFENELDREEYAFILDAIGESSLLPVIFTENDPPFFVFKYLKSLLEPDKNGFDFVLAKLNICNKIRIYKKQK